MSHTHSPWIEITTIFPCAVNCSYCPQALWKSVYKGERLLTLDNFKRALSNVPLSVMVDFSGFAEPFLNPDCIDMIEHACSSGYRVELKSTFIGLTDEAADRLDKLKLGTVWYHAPPYDHAPGISAPDGKKRPPRVGDESPYASRAFVTHTQRVHDAVHTTRAGNLSPETPKDWDSRRICAKSRDHKVNVMMPNGDVYICCCDYGLKHKLGNLFETHYDELSRQWAYELCRTCPDWVIP